MRFLRLTRSSTWSTTSATAQKAPLTTRISMPGSTVSRPLFVDASGWFALLNRREGAIHQKANALFASHARSKGVMTTEYVLQETATLLRSHSLPHIERNLFALIE